MANWTTLKTAIANVIKTNGNQEITGQLLQNTLNDIVSNVGENATFAGVAVPTTNPGTPDGPVFYIASQPGTYANFGGYELVNDIVILRNNSANNWDAIKTGIQPVNAVNAMDFLAADSDLTSYPSGAIKSFIIQPTANIKEGNNYYISYIYNISNRFLFQIIDDNSVVIAQLFIDGSNLSGKQWITINNKIGNLPFAKAYIDPELFTSGVYNFNKQLHLKTSAEGFESLTPAYIVPAGDMNIDIEDRDITITIPALTRIFHLNYLYQTSTDTIIQRTLEEPMLLIWNKSTNEFGLVELGNAKLNDYRNIIVLGEVNRYGHRMLINSTNLYVNGVRQNFIAPPTAPYKFSKDAFASQKMAQVLENIGTIYDKNIDLSVPFPYWCIRDMRIIECEDMSIFYRNGALKDLYIVYMRKIGIRGNSTSIIQIGEKIGNSVGVNLNKFAEASSVDAQKTIETLIAVGQGIKIAITVDWTDVVSTSYSYTTEIPLHVPALLAQIRNVSVNEIYNTQAIPLKYGFWKNPTNKNFNYNAILRLEMVKGDPALLYNEDGTLKELYLVFIRLNNFKGGPANTTNIIQLAWKNGETVGVNNVIFASSNTSDTKDMSETPIVEFDLFGNAANGFGGIQLSCIIDTSLIPASFNSNTYLSDTLQLNTLLFAEQLKSYKILQENSAPIFDGKKIVCFGDSVTEFSTYPEQIAAITGAETYKIGFGGCRMGKRSGTGQAALAYDQLSMYRIAQSIAAEDFTEMAAAIEYLKNNASDNNEAAFNRLISIDFSTVDIVTIFFGTNDFTSDENTIGEKDSTDPMTIKGAINIIVNSLLTKYPNLRIAFITPTHRFFNGTSWSDSDLVPNSLGLYLIDYCDAIISQANYNHIPALDMYRNGGFNKQNHEYYFGTDGVHPNSIGYSYLAQKFSAYLQTLFRY